MYMILKRVMDLLLSTVALVMLSWLLIPCMVILKLSGEHEVWYLQKRVGFKNRRFNIFKFATMLKNSPNMGTGSLTTRNDPRVLPFGSFLRKTKINELPQIFNVFNGTMSIVGPRPQMEVDFARYPEAVQEHIYDAVPGMTGIGSVIFRDEEKYLSAEGVDPIAFYTNEIAPYKGALELWYLQKRSLFTDFKIMFVTGWVIIFPESKLVHKFFKDLPEAPAWLKE